MTEEKFREKMKGRDELVLVHVGKPVGEFGSGRIYMERAAARQSGIKEIPTSTVSFLLGEI